MKIPRALLLPLLLAGCGCAVAQQGDPLKSPDCGAGLAVLDAARSGNADPARVEALRSAAAGTCLGTSALPSRPSRIAQPPVVIPPPLIELPQAFAPLRPPVLPPPPPVAIQRLPLPGQCDTGGCWSNDGTHLRHVPPSLAGTSGLCTQQGGLVYCP